MFLAGPLQLLHRTMLTKGGRLSFSETSLRALSIERLALLADGRIRRVAGHMERALLAASDLPSPLPRLPIAVTFQ